MVGIGTIVVTKAMHRVIMVVKSSIRISNRGAQDDGWFFAGFFIGDLGVEEPVISRQVVFMLKGTEDELRLVV